PQPEQMTEIWNLVFMEFYDKENGEREKLSVPCVDTGMGLERLCAVLQNKKSNYHTDLFSEIIKSLESASGCKYDFDEKNQTEQEKAFRVLADHSRAICFLISDGVIPGNEKDSYVLRRIIRRALYYSQKLHPEKNLLQVGVSQTLSLMSEIGSLFKSDETLAPIADIYLSLKEDKKRIQSIIEGETKKFSDSLKGGEKQLEEIMESPDKSSKKIVESLRKEEKQREEIMESLSNSFLPAEVVWHLYNTYGFPTDLTRLIAKEKGWTIPSDPEIKQYIKDEITEPKNQKIIKDSFREQTPAHKLLAEKHKKKQNSIEEQKQVSSRLFLPQKETAKRIKAPAMLSVLAQSFWSIIEKINFTGYEKKKKERKKQEEKQKHKTKKYAVSHRETKYFIKQYASRYTPAIQSQIEKTNFTGYEKDKEESNIVFIGSVQRAENIGAPSSKGALTERKEGWLVLDKTCFYPEGGGPVGDKGLLKTDTGKAEVLDCQKEGNFIWQKIKILEGELKENQNCQMEVYKNYRQGIKSHHTATHLLNSALRRVLGNSVRQKGSLIEPYFLRFDFTHPQALTQKQINEVEKQILEPISQAEEVSPSYKTFEQAQKEGYIYLKGENYPSQARVLKIGKDTSKELCGGVHVKNTSEIESFKIIKEEGLGSGVRRITAYTSSSLKAWEQFLVRQNQELRKFLKLSENKDFKTTIANERNCWEGNIEEENPFLQIFERKEKELKFLRQKIVKLDTQESEKNFNLNGCKFAKVKTSFHPLAQQILKLRDFLKLPLPKIKETNDFSELVFTEESSSASEESNNLPLDFFKNKEQGIQNLKNLLKEIKKQDLNIENLDKKVKEFNIKDSKARLLVLQLPLEDRKILSDLSDFVLSQLKLSILILFGESQTGKHPVFVNLNKSAPSVLSAGAILKNDIAPLLNGKGGGKPHFAQGSVQDRTKISELDNLLIKKWC
ncbi:MAG: alanine--tRNA ligase-related protein, partial [Oligoflexia bacterium]|nr:alanine--tRNA ligase-related protein [Oligoflexia bacterium]